MKYKFRNLRPSDLDELELNLLPINKEEIKALTNMGIKEYFIKLPSVFDNTKVWLVDNKIITVFGGLPDKNRDVNIWLLCTKNLFEYKNIFSIWTLKLLKKEIKNYNSFNGLVYDKNSLTKKWLKRMGFDILQPKSYGVNGELFCEFKIENKLCVQD